MFSPEFAQHWLADHEVAASGIEDSARDHDSLSRSQQEALEELADRVNAARTVY